MTIYRRALAAVVFAVSLVSLAPVAEAGRTPTSRTPSTTQRPRTLKRTNVVRQPRAMSRNYLPTGMAINPIVEQSYWSQTTASTRGTLGAAAKLVKSLYAPGRKSNELLARVIRNDNGDLFTTADNGNRTYIVDVARSTNSAQRQLVRLTVAKGSNGRITITSAQYHGFSIRVRNGALPSSGSNERVRDSVGSNDRTRYNSATNEIVSTPWRGGGGGT